MVYNVFLCISPVSLSVIYPEIKATEVPFSALKCYLCSFIFRITKLNWGNPKKRTVYYTACSEMALFQPISSLDNFQ